MSEKSSYAAGTPSFVDYSSPDIDASVDFYGGLFGWDVPAPDNVEETGGYRMAMLRGKAIAGMMPIMQEGQPPAWQSYVTVEDADATAAAVGEAGGQTVVAPMDVLDAGRMAVFTDPAGAFFAVWEPRAAVGSELVNEPGALCWNELNTRDVEAAQEFYGAVFGWEFERAEMPDGGSYTSVNLGGEAVAGILDQAERGIPEEVPSYWAVYFAVEDADAAIAKAEALGGSVMVPPVDIPIGRFAFLQDPHGASFAVIALN